VTASGECKNCGAALAGAYCSACGQKGDVRILSLGRLLADVIGDLYNFDSRIWRSLGTLTFKPGRMTRRYLEGQRAKYTPPFRMYVVTSVAFFLVFSLVRPPADFPTAASIDESVDAAVVAAEEEGFNVTRADDGTWRCEMDQGLNPNLRARLEAACRKIEADSGASFGRAFADNVPLMMLVFIPIVAAAMKVLYLFSRRKYVEHLLFFVHVHTFFFLTALIGILLRRGAEVAPWLEWLARIADLALWSYFPIYLYLAMRHVYRQGYALTAVKYVALVGSYSFALMLTLLGMIVYTAVTL
jgi:Protein of unknown function (DUF3667)